MPRFSWERWREIVGPYEGYRVAGYDEVSSLDVGTQEKIEKIVEALEWTRLLIFEYAGTSRVVAPFVVGLSFELNPLMRGFQLEGFSLSGKGAGWRVFQVNEMDNVASHQEFFEASEFEFDRDYPWIYRVLKIL